ncbi:hypothetical protein QEN19_003582 [Hanseniaspora menglaensis]
MSSAPDDDGLFKRHSISSINSLNTFRSMSTYQTYLTYGTSNNFATSVNRNESRRLLDKLEFTAEEEMLIKTLKKNVSTRNLVDPKAPGIKKNLDSSVTSFGRSISSSDGLRLEHNLSSSYNKQSATAIHKQKDSSTSQEKENSFKFISSKYSLNEDNPREINHQKPFLNGPKQTHKKTMSWSMSSSRDKNFKEDVLQQPNEENIVSAASPAFIKQHKKKNSSFSIKNLFKKPNNHHQPSFSNNNFTVKYDSFQRLDDFQYNGNDDEFLSSLSDDIKSSKNNNIGLSSSNASQQSDEFMDQSIEDSVELNSQVSNKRRNLISSEVPDSQNSLNIFLKDLEKSNRTISELKHRIDDYLNKAIVLKQQNRFTESTDCLLLSILEYKKKFQLLKSLSRTDDLKDRTPFLLYGIALKMSIGCEYDLEASVENLKVACGLLNPDNFDVDDFAVIEDKKLMGYLDCNNILIPEKVELRGAELDHDIIGPAFYELALNYLHSFLNISIKKDSIPIFSATDISLNHIQEGLKYLSKSIISYEHADSFLVLLEIFAKGIKMSNIFVITPNKINFNAWLKVCENKKLDIPPALNAYAFSFTGPRKLKRNDTLERLNFLKEHDSSSDENESSVSVAETISSPSVLSAEKSYFERKAFLPENESDDDLSDIMATYL